MSQPDNVPVWTPLTQERHGLRRWRRYTDYGFARHRRAVPLVLNEVEAVAASLPVVFGRPRVAGMPSDAAADAPDHAASAALAKAPAPGGLVPLALLATDPDGATPFVSDEGRWLTLYVPAALRVYPFAALTTGVGAQMALLVDEAGGHVTDDVRDERFFDPLGAPSPALDRVVTFFRSYAAFAQKTEAAIAALLAVPDLVVPLRAPDLSEAHAEGLWMLDRGVFDALDDAGWLALRPSGALLLAHAHFISLAQIGWVQRAEAGRALAASGRGGIASAAHGDRSPAADVSDFLAAMGLGADDAPNGGPTGSETPPTRDDT